MKQRSLIILLITSLFLVSCAANKNVIDKRDVMYAMIYDFDNNPVSGAEIYINGKFLGTSDIQGRFLITYQGKKEISVEIKKSLYEDVQAEIIFDTMQIGYFKMGNAGQYYVLAEENLSYGKFNKALEYVEKAENLDSSRADIIYLKALLLSRLGRKDEANIELEKIKERNDLIEYVNALRMKNDE